MTLPNGVTNLSSYYVEDDGIYGTFVDCSKLSSITLPSSLKTIGMVAFNGCSKLPSIDIPSSVTSIGSGAFEECTSLSSISLPSNLKTIGDSAFDYSESLPSINIPASVTSIGTAFSGCSALKSMTLPFVGGTPTDSNTFGYIFGMKSFTRATSTYQNDTTYYIPGTLTSVNLTGNSVKDNAFQNCAKLTNISIPNVTSIGRLAFFYCTSLSSIDIPLGVTSIDYEAFYNCTSLSSINIPLSVTSIGEQAFYYCISPSSINIPSSVKSIGDSAFSTCLSLTSVNIPASVTTIGDEAFFNCKLSEVFIPSSVSSIGTDVFSNNRNLKSIVFGKTYASSGQIAFATNTNLKTFPNISDTATVSYGYINFEKNLPNVTTFTFPYAQTQINEPMSNDNHGNYGFFSVESHEIIEKITFRFARAGTWKLLYVNDEDWPEKTIKTVSITIGTNYTYYSSDDIISTLCTFPRSPTNEESYWYCFTRS